MLVVKFKFKKIQNWNFDQHILQGIFLKAIEDKYHGFKFGILNFSNIYPFEKGKDYNTDTIYELKIRSISDNILFKIFEYLNNTKYIDFNNENTLEIQKIFYKEDNLPFEGKIIKGITPIVLSINKNLAKKYNISFNRKDDKPLYWNKNMGFEIFVKQLTKNIVKKYILFLQSIKNNEIRFEELNKKFKILFSKLQKWEEEILILYKNKKEFEKFINKIDFFEGYKFKRGALIPYKGGKIAGSVWDFKINNQKDNNIDFLKILKLNYILGFGEKTTAGFGFMI